MRKTIKIAGISLAAVAVVIYLIVSICLSWWTQSLAGSVASNYFTQEWGGKVHIGLIQVNPLGSVALKNIELVSPEDDTIFNCKNLSVRFVGMPIDDEGLRVSRVTLKDAYYHLEIRDGDDINLNFIIKYFQERATIDTTDTIITPFIIRAKRLILNNIEYRMDLYADSTHICPAHGVCILHQHYYEVNGRFDNIRVNADNISCSIVSFSAREQSGFALNEMSCDDVKVSPYLISAQNMLVVTDSTRLSFDGSLQFNTWDAMSEYCDSVNHTLTMNLGSVVDAKDISYWVPLFWGVQQRIYVNGHAEGPVAHLNVDDFHIDMPERLDLSFNGRMNGLPNIDNTNCDLTIDNMHASFGKLSHVKLPDAISFEWPDVLNTIDHATLNGRIQGSMKHLDAQMHINTAAGDIEADMALKQNRDNASFSAEAHIASQMLTIAKVLPGEWMPQTGIRAKVSVSDIGRDDMAIDAEGELFGTVLHGVPLHNTTFDASYANERLEADADIIDDLLSLSATFAMSQQDDGCQYTIDALIDHCALSRLGLIPSDSLAQLSTHLRGDIYGQSLNDMSGNLSLSNSTLQLDTNIIKLKNILLSVREVENYKNISLFCDWFNISTKGFFEYEDIPIVARYFCHQFVPTYFNPSRNDAEYTSRDVTLSFETRWRGAYSQLSSIGLPISLASGTIINGTYNNDEELRIVVRSDSIASGEFTLKDIVLQGKTKQDGYQLRLESSMVNAGGPPLLDNLSVNATVRPDSTDIGIRSGRRGNISNITADFTIKSDTAENAIFIRRGEFDIAGSHWHLSCPDGLHISNGHYDLSTLLATDNTQSFMVSLSIAGDEDDYVYATMRNFSLGWISQQWLSEYGFAIEGQIGGGLGIHGFNGTPYVVADLNVDSCVINKFDIGQLSLQTDWTAETQHVNFKLASKTKTDTGYYSPILFSGGVDFSHSDPDIQVDGGFDHFPLQTVAPLLASFASRFEGELHGDIHVGGTISNPQLFGKAIVEDGILGIASTGVSYRFNDTLLLDGKTLLLKDFQTLDPLNNILNLDGEIHGLWSSNISMSVKFNSPNFMLLSIPERSDILSGLIMSSLSGTVSGDLRDLDIDITARTNRGSVISVPVNDRKDVSDGQFITFVNPQANRNDAKKPVITAPAKASPVNLRLALSITPDLRLKLPMNFQQFSPNLSASGNGEILVALPAGSSPTITGNYELTSGNLTLEMFSFLSTNFTLDPGSSIMLPGSVENARFNISTSHLVHANLASLMGTTTDGMGRTVNVENVIILSGTLTNPKISFDIRLPGADKSLEDEIFAYIDRNSEREMFTQSISLLLSGQFTNVSSNATVLDNASYNIVSSTISNMVSNAIKVVDVNIGYQGETTLTNEQFDIDIRKEWDRFYFETTFGYGGEARSLNTTDNNSMTNIVGDVLVGYKINPRLHFFVFNRTNTNDFTRTDLPYKQGAGLKLTRDFNRWDELFKGKKQVK